MRSFDVFEQIRPITIDFARLLLWFAILAIVFIPIERLVALHPKKKFRAEIWSDVGYYFLNSLAPSAILVIPSAVLAGTVHFLLPETYYNWVGHWPPALHLVAVVIVGEVGFYWGHRWTHEIPALWRFHAVHHSAEQIDWLVNTRAHPVDMVFTRLCGLIPLHMLGLTQAADGTPSIVVALFIVISTAWGFLIHANVRLRMGPIESLIATPAFHHWHHTNDEHRDRNYAAMLPCLDRLFGTFHLPRGWPTSYGVDDKLPAGLARQLIRPFRR